MQFCKLGLGKKKDHGLVEVEHERIPTSLTIHFFGAKGDRPLTFGQFSTFLHNFQREILLTEFMEYSGGLDTINVQDFADILLKHTTFSNQVS